MVQKLARMVGNHLDGTPCEVFSESTKVRVDNAILVPDVFVTCSRQQPNSSTVADAPVIVVEVTSRNADNTWTLSDHGAGDFLRLTRID